MDITVRVVGDSVTVEQALVEQCSDTHFILTLETVEKRFKVNSIGSGYATLTSSEPLGKSGETVVHIEGVDWRYDSNDGYWVLVTRWDKHKLYLLGFWRDLTADKPNVLST